MAKLGKKFTAKKAAEGKRLGGIHIYVDERGRSVYYDVLTKIGYLIDDYEQEYRPYSMRFIIGLFGGILMYMFEAPLLLCGAIGVVAYIFMEVKFRLFLRKVPQLLDFNPTKRVSFIQSAANETSGKIVLKLILYLALGILFVVNAYMEHYDGLMMIVSWLLGCFGVFFAIIHIVAINKQLKAGTFHLNKK